MTYLGGSGGEHKLIGRYFSINNNVANDQSQKSNMKYLEYRYRHSLEKLNMEFTAGLVYTGTRIEAKLYGDTVYTSTNIAGYVSLDKTFFKKLTINAGARYEYNKLTSPEMVDGIAIPNGETSESKPVFKLGANFLLTRYSSIRASWGQGYRYPTVAEKFIKTTAGAIRVSPNPNLESETGYSAEIGIKQGLKIANWKGFVDVAFFRSDYDNMMEFVLQNISKGFQSFNIGDTRIQGYEIGIQGAGNIGNVTIRTLCGYTNIEPTYRNFSEIDTFKSTVTYNVLKYRMKHSFRGDIGLVYKGFEVGTYYQYNSKMEAIDKVFDLGIPGVHDFRASHDRGSNVIGFRVIVPVIMDKLTVGFNLNNALNEEYSTRPGLLEAPRNFSMRLDWKF
ncbi:MAG: TonB-dependent receptor [Saprospiraceae bacterium]|nr:TonB-dependent receptor [Candidatus Brachybacter algidus]